MKNESSWGRDEFQWALSIAGFHESTWIGDLGDLEKLFDAARAAPPIAPGDREAPLTNIACDVIDGYKAGLAGQPMGMVSAAFDCGWLSGDSERAAKAQAPTEREALIARLRGYAADDDFIDRDGQPSTTNRATAMREAADLLAAEASPVDAKEHDSLRAVYEAARLVIQSHCHPVTVSELSKTTEAVKATAGRWITVAQRLPPPGMLVLLALDGRVVRIGFCNENAQNWGVLTEREEEDLMAATHWMPLPELP